MRGTHFSVLVLGFEFGRSPTNRIYPNYQTKFKNNSNTIKFLKGKKITKSEWEQLLLFKSKIDEIKKIVPILNLEQI